MSSLKSKIISLAALKLKVTALRRQGKIIAFTNGCFDLMHKGHVAYLEKAKGTPAQKRVLIVGLNSDKSVKALDKGSNRPICPQDSRAAVLAALEAVDFVVMFNEDTPYNLIKAIQPDVLVKGADYKGKPVVGADLVKARGGKLELIKFVKGFSSSHIIEKIRKSI